MKQTRIFTLTLGPSIDKSSSIPHLLPEHKLRCTEPVFEPGGGGINVSRALKRMNATSTAIYMQGGPSGVLLEKLLTDEGVKQLPIPCQNWTRENLVILESQTNQQFRFVMPSPEVLPSEWASCLAIINDLSTEIDYLVVSGSIPKGIPPNFIKNILDITTTNNIKLILDTSGDHLLQAVKEGGLFLLKPNTSELSSIVGRSLKTIHDQEEAALEIIASGKVEYLVVSMGPSGALIATKEGVYHAPAPAVKKQSTVGAGDCMVAGLVYYFSEGKTPLEALQYGVASGTAATMNKGTQLSKLEDIKTLYKWISEQA